MSSNECCASLCRQNTLCIGGGATANLEQTTVPVFTLMLEKITQGVGSMWECIVYSKSVRGGLEQQARG